jgi:hypothetical protein
MYRKKRRTRPARIGRDVVGFYTRNHTVRPITRRRPRATLPRLDLTRIVGLEFETPLLEKAADYVLRQAPIAGEIRAAYSVADALYSNWGIIMNLYNAYKKGGPQGVANTIATNTVHDGLSNLQTDALWAAISRFIPQKYHHAGKQILASLMGAVTTIQIKLAKQFLPPSRKIRPPEHKVGSTQSASSTTPRYEEDILKWPKGVDVV